MYKDWYYEQDPPQNPSQGFMWLKNMSQSTHRELKREPRKFWLFYSGKCESTHDAYRGKAIILVNRNTLSTSEIAVSMAKCLEASILIGENTGGMLAFGETLYYQLPHSRLRLILPHKIFLPNGLREGRGFLPDFWLDSHDPVEEIIRWLKNLENYRYILGG